jgi:hypothetical protein
VTRFFVLAALLLLIIIFAALLAVLWPLHWLGRAATWGADRLGFRWSAAIVLVAFLSGCASTKVTHDEGELRFDASTWAKEDREPSTIDTHLTLDEPPPPETPADVAPVTPLAEVLRPELAPAPMPQPGVALNPEPWAVPVKPRLPRPGAHLELNQHEVIGATHQQGGSETHAAGHEAAGTEQTRTPEMPKLPFSCAAGGGIALAIVVLVALAYYRKGIAGRLLGIVKRFIP